MKNLCIFHQFKKSFVFFTTLEKPLHFSPEQVTHYNKTTLKNLHTFHYFEKSFVFFTTLKNLRIFHLDRLPTIIWPFQIFWILPRGRFLGATIPIQKVFFKDHLFLCKSYLLFFRVRFLALILQIMCFLVSFFSLWVRFWALTSNTFRRIDHFLIWWVCYFSFIFLLYKAYYLKSLTRLYIVSIVKRGQLS